MLRNSRVGYGIISIVLHWTMAALILCQVSLGLTMLRVESQRLAFELVQWHKSLGLLLLLLAVLRLVWRLASPVPDLPPTVPRLEAVAARASHRGLYFFMFALPLSGWALVSVSVLGVPTFAFYLVLVPHLPLTPSESAEALWSAVHSVLAYCAIAVIAVHVAAALRHHFLLGDQILMRMLFPQGGRKASDPGKNRAP